MCVHLCSHPCGCHEKKWPSGMCVWPITLRPWTGSSARFLGPAAPSAPHASGGRIIERPIAISTGYKHRSRARRGGLSTEKCSIKISSTAGAAARA
ncbi:hypothetical protein AVEN_126916-1 [Araneus ventricosus]|uniref:Uncharacterized protein n=1 Tax=Araneus ventricosus TaxID=182803 RepID=A0A4Y2C1Q2_ARAVE|nr:hypothetical protein AVEN_126916-1 [Araneus ventricosus]